MAGRSNNSTIPPDAGLELYGFKDYEERLKKLERAARGTIDGIAAPSLDCTPNPPETTCPDCSCAVLDQRGVRDGGNTGIYPLIKYLIPRETYALITKIIRVDDWDSADPERHKKIIKHRTNAEDITDDDRESERLVAEFQQLLEEETDYYIIYLQVRNLAGDSFAVTPPTEPVPGDGVNPGQYLAKFRTKKIVPANPSDPSCDDIVKNEPNLLDEIIGNASVEFVIDADKNGELSVEDLDVDRAIIFLLPIPGGYPIAPIPIGTKPEQFNIELTRDNLFNRISDIRHMSLKIPISLPLGKRYIWYRTVLVNAGGRAGTDIERDENDLPIIDPDQSCNFWAGGRSAASDAEIPIPSITLVDNQDSRNTDIHVTFTQTIPVLLKTLEGEISYNYDPLNPNAATWLKKGDENLRAIEKVNGNGTHTVKVPIVHHKNRAQKTWYLRVRLAGVGKIPDVTESDGRRAPQQYSAVVGFVPFYGKPLGHAGVALTADFASTINTDTDTADAFVSCVVRCYKSHPTDDSPMDGRDAGHSPAEPLSFKDAHVTEVTAILSSDNLGSNEKHKIRKEISTEAERSANSITATKVLPGLGEHLFWKKTKFLNGDGHTVTVFPTPIDIHLGGVKVATANADVPVPSIQSIVADGNRHSVVNVRFTQTSPQATYLLKLVLEINVNNTGWKKEDGFDLKGGEQYHTPGTTYDIPLYATHPANKPVKFRVKLIAVKKFESPYVEGAENTSPGDVATAPAPLTTPTGPAAIFIIANAIDGDVANGLARIKIKIQTANGGTFAANQITEAWAIFKRAGETGPLFIPFGGAIDDLTQSEVIIDFTYPIGWFLTWKKNIFKNGDQETVTTGSQDLLTGTFIQRPTVAGDLPAITIQSVNIVNNKNIHFHFRFTQGVVPFALEMLQLEKSIDGGTDWIIEKEKRVASNQFHTPSTTYDIKMKASTPAASNVRWRVSLLGVGGVRGNYTFHPSSGDMTTPVDTLPPPATTPTAPSTSGLFLIANTVDGDPTNGNARIVVKVETANGLSFSSQRVKEVFAIFNLLGATNEKSIQGGVVPDSSLSSMQIEFFVPIGTSVSWVKNKFVNGDQETVTTGTASFIAGLLNPIPGDGNTVPTGAIVSVTPRNNKKDTIVVRADQVSSGQMQELGFLTVEQDDGNGFEEVRQYNIKNRKALYTGVGANLTFPAFNVRRTPGTTSQYRCKQTSVGGKDSAYNTFGATASSTPDAPTDAGIPNAPAVSHKIAYGIVDVYCSVPTTNANTRIIFQILLSTSATPPASTPTVGAENVVAIINAQTGSFRIPRAASTQQFWIHAHAANAVVGSFSLYTTIALGARENYDRPLDDFIGTGVILMPTGTTAGTYGDFNNSVGIGDADLGFPNTDLTGTQRRVPFRVRFDAEAGRDTIEVWMPTGENAFSLKYVEWERRRGNAAGPYKGGAVIVPGFVTVIRVPGQPSSYRPVYRIRFNNAFRGTLTVPSDGWSAWSYYVGGTQTGGTSAPTYDPEVEIPPTGDLISNDFLPIQFPTF